MIEPMVAGGVIAEHARFEQTGGQVVPLSPKGVTHEKVKAALNWHLQRAAPDTIDAIPEAKRQSSPDSYIEPDFAQQSREVHLGLPVGTRPSYTSERRERKERRVRV